MNVPNIPSNCSDAATYIWDQQDILNARCHPTGKGTIDLAGTRTEADRRKLEFDYYLALHDEISELINNFIWKHWAKEAREGRRFTLINPEGTGEGTAQNVWVELTDIVFFTVSLLHVRDAETTWKVIWGNEDNWNEAKASLQRRGITIYSNLGNPKANEFLLNELKAFEIAFFAGYNDMALCSLLEVFAASGLNWQDAANLYYQKLRVNHERVDRGRKQVGDELAHGENATIKT